MQPPHNRFSGCVLSFLFVCLGVLCDGVFSGFNLLPKDGLHFVQDTFDLDGAVCSPSEVIRATYDAFALPTTAKNFAFAVYLDDLQSSSKGTMVTLENAALELDASKELLVLKFPDGEDLDFGIPLSPNRPLELGISRREDGSFKICADGKDAALTTAGNAGVQVDEAGWLALTDLPSFGLSEKELVLGDPGAEGKSFTGLMQYLVLYKDALDCSDFPLAMAEVVGGVSDEMETNDPPVISHVWHSPEKEIYVGTDVTVSAGAVDLDGDEVKIRATFFGVSPPKCDVPTCGDFMVEKLGLEEVEVHASVSFPRAGRYIVRIEASDMMGKITVEDHEILVRKNGDLEGKAKCCRYTGMVIAQQLGRPIHASDYRHPSVYEYAKEKEFMWSDEYLNTDDLESERLFDFGILAPPQSGPLSTVTCHDTRVAGPGSKKVMSYTHDWRMTGHNKRIITLQEGLPWGTWDNLTVTRPECASHFTNWAGDSPYKGKVGSRTCSYACTANGVSKMISDTGSYDRLAEAIIEVTYGRASFAWDVTVTKDIIELPLDTKTNLFTYHDRPSRDYFKDKLGFDLKDKYFQAVVMSPWPHHNNPGQLAWSSGSDNFPAIFVLRCNPQMYYLFHETGHRFGLPHSVAYKLDNATNAPADPLGSGVIADSYTDKLDIMACCKGNFNLYSRIYAGWVKGNERIHLPLEDLQQTKTHRFTLWPFDRPESRDRLMGVTMRLAEDKILSFGFRSVPFFQDVKMGRWPRDTSTHALAHEDMRHNIRGLAVGYTYRFSRRGTPTWSIRGLLDFNVLFGEWPSSMPKDAGAYPGHPGYDAYAQLKEAYPWFHKDGNVSMMVMVERLRECPQPSDVPVYNYTVKGFYGWRGEFPFQERAEKHDYTGFEKLECLDFVIRTGVEDERPPGRLEMNIEFADANDEGEIHTKDICGLSFQPRVRAVFPENDTPSAIVWKDNLNKTIATDTTTILLTPLVELRESSNKASPLCENDCPKTFTVKAATSDGRHVRAEIDTEGSTFDSYVLKIRYTHYETGAINSTKELKTARIVRSIGSNPEAPLGVNIFGSRTGPYLKAGIWKYPREGLPTVDCSQQWTLSAMIQVNQDREVGSWSILSISSTPHERSGSDPLLQMHRSSKSEHYLLIKWLSGEKKVDISRHLKSEEQPPEIHLFVIRDHDRLGVWVNGEGEWITDDVWCMPTRDDILFCDHESTGEGFEWGQDSNLWVGEAGSGADGEMRYLRVYNYVVPPKLWRMEMGCSSGMSGTCARMFMLQHESTHKISLANPGTDLGPSMPPKIEPPNVEPSENDTPVIQPSPPPKKPTDYEWAVGPWGHCTAHCGGGLRYRTVKCLEHKGGDRNAVDPSLCLDQHRPSTQEVCNLVVCSKHRLFTAARSRDDDSHVCLHVPECGISDREGIKCFSDIGFAATLDECDVNTYDEFAVIQDTMLQPEGASCTLLKEQCTSDAPYHWTFSPWSACSAACGGGNRTRSIICASQNGTVVDSALCNKKLKNAFDKHDTTQTCNSNPCEVYVWEVGQWEVCHGEGEGYTLRDVKCIDGGGKAAKDSFCISRRPVDSGLCTVDESSAPCRPLNSPADEKDCLGFGTCSFDGCTCDGGYHGAHCQTPPSCTGILGRNNVCCSSGILDDSGSCCPENSALNAEGHCCSTRNVDKCGVCGGNGKKIDILGNCCTNDVLDQSGACCDSGFVDECGVCDGDSSSCATKFNLLLSIGKNASDTGSFEELDVDELSMTQQDRTRIVQALMAATVELLGIEIASVEFGSLEYLEGSSTMRRLQSLAQPKDSQLHSRSLAQNLGLGNRTTNRGWSLGVLVLGGSKPLSVDELMQKLGPFVSSRDVFAILGDNSSSTLLANAVARLVNVFDATRVGTCGNKMCEVGEQVAFGSNVFHSPMNSNEHECSEDCPFPLRLCPTPRIGAVGEQTTQCGGNGACLPSSGACQCSRGYSGDACDECEPGYVVSRGLCQKEYINGTWVMERLPIMASETKLDETEPGKETEQKSAGLPLPIIVGAAGGFVVLIVVVLVGVFAIKRRRRKNSFDKALGNRLKGPRTDHVRLYNTIHTPFASGPLPSVDRSARYSVSGPSAPPLPDREPSPVRVVRIQGSSREESPTPVTTISDLKSTQTPISNETAARIRRMSSALHGQYHQSAGSRHDAVGHISVAFPNNPGEKDTRNRTLAWMGEENRA